MVNIIDFGPRHSTRRRRGKSTQCAQLARITAEAITSGATVQRIEPGARAPHRRAWSSNELIAERRKVRLARRAIERAA
jgi:hypothetical protein